MLSPLLRAFFALNSHSKEDQEASVETGLQLLRDLGPQLKIEGWQAVFRGVISPFIQTAFALADQANKSAPQSKDLNYSELVKSTLREVYIMLTEEKGNFDIIREFMRTLEQQIVDGEKQLIELYFGMVFDAIEHKPLTQLSGHMAELLMTTIRKSIPYSIFDNALTKLIDQRNLRSDSKLDLDFSEIDTGFNVSNTIYRCSVLLEAVKVTNKIVSEHLAHIPAEKLDSLVQVVQEAHAFCVKFNQDLLLRYLLCKTGYKSINPNIPSVYGIERFSADIILKYSNHQLAAETVTAEQRTETSLK